MDTHAEYMKEKGEEADRILEEARAMRPVPFKPEEDEDEGFAWSTPGRGSLAMQARRAKMGGEQQRRAAGAVAAALGGTAPALGSILGGAATPTAPSQLGAQRPPGKSAEYWEGYHDGLRAARKLHAQIRQSR